MQRLFNSFIKKVKIAVYNHFFATDNMLAYCVKETIFERFPDCLEAVDVAFQKSYQQGNNTKEKQYWTLDKHHQPGLKNKGSSWSGWTSLLCIQFIPWIISKYYNFKEGIDEHFVQLVKEDNNIYKQDNMTVKEIE